MRWRPCRPLVLFACALSIGCLAGSLLEFQSRIIAILIVAFFVSAASAFFIRRSQPLLTFVLVAFASSVVGFVLAAHAVRGALAVSVPLDSNRSIVCEGRVAGDSVEGKWNIKFPLELISCEVDGKRNAVSGTVRASAAHKYVYQRFVPGDIVVAPFVFKRPRDFPGSGSFSYVHYLLSRGIGTVAYARGSVDRIETATGVMAAMSRERARLSRMIEDRLPPLEAQIVGALATGRRGGMDTDLRESFSRAGVAHVLAISGLHVGYVALLIYLLVRLTLGRIPSLISRVPLARLAAMATLPAMWLYILFVGAPMSAIRAGLMLSIYFAGVIAGLRKDLPSTLACAVIAILVLQPLAVLDISFQLSVTAVAGIAAAAIPAVRRIDGAIAGEGAAIWFARRTLALVALSIAAALFTAPLVAYHFGTFTALGPLTNVVAVPLVGFALMPAIIVASLVTPISPWAAGYVFEICGRMAGLLIAIAREFSDAGAFLTGDVSPTLFEMAVAYAAIGGAVYGLSTFSQETNFHQPKGPFSTVA